jgi:hypothetical protein
MKFYSGLFFCALYLLSSNLWAQEVETYALQWLSDSRVSQALKQRFKAEGEPVFLISNPQRGISSGDLIRFRDKVILIDERIFGSLQADGVLRSLRSPALVQLRAKSEENVWSSRAKQTSGPQAQMYALGAEWQKILHETFGTDPSKGAVILKWEGPYLNLWASQSLAQQLKRPAPKKVESPKPQIKRQPGQPLIVSPSPDPLRVGADWTWQVWAVDSAQPAAQIKYQIRGQVPPGISWDPDLHQLQGTAQIPGEWELTAIAINAAGRKDELNFRLEILPNRGPECQVDTLWRIPQSQGSHRVSCYDPDDAPNTLNWKIIDASQAPAWNLESGILSWDSSLVSPKSPLSIAVEDPWGSVDTALITILQSKAATEDISQAIEVILPTDTLIQKHCRIWHFPKDQMGALHIDSVRGEDFTIWQSDSLHSSLKVCPQQSKSHQLTWFLSRGSSSNSLQKTLPVRPNRAPQWIGKDPLPGLLTGDSLRWTAPVADPDEDSIHYQWQIPAHCGSAIGAQITLKPQKPGHCVISLKAHDSYGDTLQTTLAFKVLEIRPLLFSAIKNQQWMGQSFWEIMHQRDVARIGLFTTDFNKMLIPVKDLGDWYPPYLTLGASLLGTSQARKGNQLFVDLGLMLRPLSKEIWGGGNLLRIGGQWQSPQGHIAKAEWLGYIRQSMVITSDVSGYQVRKQLQECLQAGDFNCVEQVVEANQDLFPECQDFDINSETCIDNLTSYGFGKGLDRVFDGSGVWDNAGSYFDLQYLHKINPYLWVGPHFWRRDLPVERWQEQFVGGAAQARYRWRSLELEVQGSLGFGRLGRPKSDTLSTETDLDFEVDPTETDPDLVWKKPYSHGILNQGWSWRLQSQLRWIHD